MGMDVVPITVFDKAKLKKELFEMVYQNPNLLLPKIKGFLSWKFHFKN